MTKQEILDKFNDINFAYNDSSKHETLSRMLDDLLKEQEKQKRKWLMNIADNQLANFPKDFAFGTLDEHLEREYNRGVWKGLQMAYEIISNDGERKNE